MDKIDLLKNIKGLDQKVNLKTFKESVITLFDGMLKEDIPQDAKNSIARIRANIIIKFKDI